MNIDFYQTLLDLGYKLQDRGDYWQTSALYRGGDNNSAVQIYKDTGVWKDYVAGEGFKPFKALVEKTNSDFSMVTSNEASFVTRTLTGEASSIISEKLFNDDYAKYLLPHYSFYEKKSIKVDILKDLNSGLSTEGHMYQRYVFPIYNKFSKIHGLAGRDLSQKPNRPKWKHVGKKTKWIYPYFTSEKTRSSIKETKEVIVVESIGDMLNLFNNGIYNVLVSFGLDISPSLSSLIMGLNLDKIFISLNNDNSKDLNRGRISSIKNFLKLTSYINYKKLFICLPVKDDFGDMNPKDFENWLVKKKACENNHNNLVKKIKKESQELLDKKLLSKNVLKNIKNISL